MTDNAQGWTAQGWVAIEWPARSYEGRLVEVLLEDGRKLVGKLVLPEGLAGIEPGEEAEIPLWRVSGHALASVLAWRWVGF